MRCQGPSITPYSAQYTDGFPGDTLKVLRGGSTMLLMARWLQSLVDTDAMKVRVVVQQPSQLA